MKKTLLLLAIVLLGCWLLPSSVFAQSGSGAGFVPLAPIPGLTQGVVANSSGLVQFLQNLYKYLIGVAVVLAIIMITWGGIEIAARDSISKQSAGREHITQAIIGLLLILAPVLVFTIINPAILNLSVNLPPLDTKWGNSNPESQPSIGGGGANGVGTNGDGSGGTQNGGNQSGPTQTGTPSGQSLSGSQGGSPATPTNLHVTGSTSSTVDLAWNAPSSGSTATQYYIYDKGNLVGASTGTATQVQATSGSHSYTVAAVDANGNASDQTAPVTTTVGNGSAGQYLYDVAFKEQSGCYASQYGLYPSAQECQQALSNEKQDLNNQGYPSGTLTVLHNCTVIQGENYVYQYTGPQPKCSQ